MIEFLKYILIGILQGVTEVLPVSSSAHLIIFGKLLNLEITIAFEIFLHIGSLIAVLFFLRKRIAILIKGCFYYLFKKNSEYKSDFLYLVNICISTLVVVFISLFLNNVVTVLSNFICIVGIFLVINGLMMFITANKLVTYKKSSLNFKDALVIGLFESVGIFPGISRSGACLAGASVRKIDKEVAADYAFFLFIPAVVGATLLKIVEIKDIFFSSINYLNLISLIISIITTYISFKFLLRIIKKGKISIFGYYTIFLGITVFIYFY